MFITCVLVVAVVCYSFVAWYSRDLANRQKALSQALHAEPGFSPGEELIDCLGVRAMAIDEPNGKVGFAVRDTRSGPIRVIVHPFSDLTGSEIIENGTTVVKSSGAGRALVGGALFGVVGAIAGAATSKQTSHEKVTSIALKILLNDPEHLYYTLTTWTETNGVPRDSLAHTAHSGETRRWHDLIAKIVARTARDTAAHPQPRTCAPTTGVAQEIRELAALRQEGLLSDEEFQQQKEQLLRGRAAR